MGREYRCHLVFPQAAISPTGTVVSLGGRPRCVCRARVAVASPHHERPRRQILLVGSRGQVSTTGQPLLDVQPFPGSWLWRRSGVPEPGSCPDPLRGGAAQFLGFPRLPRPYTGTTVLNCPGTTDTEFTGAKHSRACTRQSWGARENGE